MSFHIIFLRFYCFFFFLIICITSLPNSSHITSSFYPPNWFSVFCFCFSFHLSGQLLMDTCKYTICMDEWDTTWCFTSWVYHIMFKSDSKHLKYCYSSAPCLVGTGRGAVLGIDPRVLLVLASTLLLSYNLPLDFWYLWCIPSYQALLLVLSFDNSHSFIKQLIISLIFISLISGTEYFFQIAVDHLFFFWKKKILRDLSSVLYPPRTGSYHPLDFSSWEPLASTSSLLEFHTNNTSALTPELWSPHFTAVCRQAQLCYLVFKIELVFLVL